MPRLVTGQRIKTQQLINIFQVNLLYLLVAMRWPSFKFRYTLSYTLCPFPSFFQIICHFPNLYSKFKGIKHHFGEVKIWKQQKWEVVTTHRIHLWTTPNKLFSFFQYSNIFFSGKPILKNLAWAQKPSVRKLSKIRMTTLDLHALHGLRKLKCTQNPHTNRGHMKQLGTQLVY